MLCFRSPAPVGENSGWAQFWDKRNYRIIAWQLPVFIAEIESRNVKDNRKRPASSKGKRGAFVIFAGRLTLDGTLLSLKVAFCLQDRPAALFPRGLQPIASLCPATLTKALRLAVPPRFV